MRRTWISIFLLSAIAAHGQLAPARLPPADPTRAGTGTGALATARSELTIPGPGPAVQKPTATPGTNTFQPTWETQKGARTYLLSIPAPRGQIVDRNGQPLAQNRISYNLGVAF